MPPGHRAGRVRGPEPWVKGDWGWPAFVSDDRRTKWMSERLVSLRR